MNMSYGELWKGHFVDDIWPSTLRANIDGSTQICATIRHNLVYDCCYRFDVYAISVRLGKAVPQTVVKTFDRNRYPLAQWKHLCIEGMLTIVFVSTAI